MGSAVRGKGTDKGKEFSSSKSYNRTIFSDRALASETDSQTVSYTVIPLCQ